MVTTVYAGHSIIRRMHSLRLSLVPYEAEIRAQCLDGPVALEVEG